MDLTTEELKAKLFRAATVLGDMQTEANAKDQRIKELEERIKELEQPVVIQGEPLRGDSISECDYSQLASDC